MTAPPTTGWSWDNQGTCTVASSGGKLVVEAPGGGITNLCGQYRTMAASINYTVDALVTLRALPALGSTSQIFVGGREAATGQAIIIKVGVNAANTSLLQVSRYNAGFTFVNDAVNITNARVGYVLSIGGPIFLRMRDNGTNIFWEISTHGEEYYTVHSEARGAFFGTAADEFIWGISESVDNSGVLTGLEEN